jgi:signal transduction histidine kinase
MTCLLNSNTYSSRRVRESIALFLLFAMLLGCTNRQNQGVQASNYNKLLDSVSHLYDTGHELKALHKLDSATTNYHNLDLRQWFAYYTHHYNYHYFMQGNEDSAGLYTDSMLMLFDSPEKKLKYPSQFGLANFYKGGVLFDQNKYEEAYQHYYQGKLVASKNLDDCTLSDYDYRLGMITYKQEHFELAAAYFKTGLEQNSKCDLTFRGFLRRQELFNNTGLCYSKIDKGDSALIYFKRGLKFIDSQDKRFPAQKEDLEVCRGVIYGNAANVYVRKNDYRTAEELLKRSIKINLKVNNDNKDAQLSELKLAHLYERENKSDSLINLLQHVNKQFDTIKNVVAEADWNLLMANYYTKKNKPELAYNYLQKHAVLKDTVANREKSIKATNIDEQMERLRKTHELETLERNNNSQQKYLKIALLLGAMSLFIIFLVCRNWLKSRKNIKTFGGLNSRISEQNHNLAYALDELSQSSREKDRILRTVAHDLRNPLGGIASLTALMAEESEYTDEQKELINLIKETSNNSLELINEILDATDDISAKSAKKKEPVEINALISQSIELLRFKAAEKHQEIRFETTEPIELNIIREQIWRVLSNLITNAIKFSTDGGLIQVTVIDEGKTIKIAVADNGIGIPDNLKEVIFNMFTDAKRPGTAGERSFGLGLSICRQIVESHKGKIWFESDGSTGTTFYITLHKLKKD